MVFLALNFDHECLYILHIFIVLFLVSSKIAQLAWFSCRLHSFVCQWVFTSKNRHIWGCWSKSGTWSTFSWFRRPPNCNNALSVLFTLIVCNRTTPVSKVHNSLYINWSRLPTNANLSLSLSLSLSLCVSLTHLCLDVYVWCFLGAVIRLKVLLLKTVLPLTKALTSREVHSLFLSQSLSLCMFCISLFHSFTSLIGPFSCVGI